ncbi:hypothetical protein Sjap_017570 [Stephania japonica]|uniref:Helicase ATP-binding domain-containing protein n=1 Tax=Stephania japonica TaxID=461633 RepID=A0AAP0NKI8_9MAGN
MASETQKPSPNPNPNPRNALHIGGIPVEFPYKPYGSQLAFMGRVISTLDRARRQGHSHALLESPTGTGKSLSLLCSTLAWQQNCKSKNLNAGLTQSKADPEAVSDPVGHGGGFIPEPEPEPSGNIEMSNSDQVPGKQTKSQRKKAVPTIYYATKLLLEDQVAGCYEFKNVHKVKGHPSIQKGGCNEAHDIEDLVKVGRAVKGCSYFAARSLAEEAQLIFCPYNYILNPTIRRSMEVDIKDSIVILDEAHNIEDMARDAGSMDIEEDALFMLQTELGSLCVTADSEIYQPLYDMIQLASWTGDKALRELQEIGISPQLFAILKECATKAIKAASDAEAGLQHLSGMSVIMLEGRGSTGWTHSLGLWCLNPAVVFREIAELSMSVILTSGTLSPMSSFSSELGVQFETCMEAPHVIDVESQLWAAAISAGPGNIPLNASYKTADNYAFQDALGASLEEICKVAPGGALVFFPSYKLMDKLCTRWRETGQWAQLNAQKPLFIEPKGSQDEFEHALKGYYDTIHQVNRPTTWKIGRGKKRDLKHSNVEGPPQHSVRGGAAFLAVCRGKFAKERKGVRSIFEFSVFAWVSEGIDFSDDNARVVVIVGIPFPNVNDIQVAQKKKFNDTYRSSKNLLSGSEWYCHQAFRALNQAAGRGIRHKFDYGAIIFLDERFREERNVVHISKWLRKSIKQFNSFEMSLEGLQSFFKDIKDRTGLSSGLASGNFDLKDENSPTKSNVISKGSAKKKTRKAEKLDVLNGRRLLPESVVTVGKTKSLFNPMCSARNSLNLVSKLSDEDNVVDLTFAPTDTKDMGNCREYIDLECNAQENSSPESFVVRETPGLYSNASVVGCAAASYEENSNAEVFQATSYFSDQLSSHSAAAENSYAVVSTHSSIVTPVKLLEELKQEMESSLNLSVNSHKPKRRKSIALSSINYSLVTPFENTDAKSPSSIHDLTKTELESASCNCLEEDCSESMHDKLQYQRRNLLNNLEAAHLCSTAITTLTEKSLDLCCSLCRNSLGLPKNQYLVSCSVTSSSKVYMTSFLKSKLKDPSVNGSTSVPIVISDLQFIDQRLYKQSTSEAAENHGIWCEKDGCVFRTVFCPFCTISDRYLGQQIVATDVQNTHLLDKILFYLNRLEIRNPEASKVENFVLTKDFTNGKTNKKSVYGDSDHELVAGSTTSHKVSFSAKQQDSGGWRTTKSKLRLPKRALLCDTEDIDIRPE